MIIGIRSALLLSLLPATMVVQSVDFDGGESGFGTRCHDRCRAERLKYCVSVALPGII